MPSDAAQEDRASWEVTFIWCLLTFVVSALVVMLYQHAMSEAAPLESRAVTANHMLLLLLFLLGFMIATLISQRHSGLLPWISSVMKRRQDEQRRLEHKELRQLRKRNDELERKWERTETATAKAKRKEASPASPEPKKLAVVTQAPAPPCEQCALKDACISELKAEVSGLKDRETTQRQEEARLREILGSKQGPLEDVVRSVQAVAQQKRNDSADLQRTRATLHKVCEILEIPLQNPLPACESIKGRLSAIAQTPKNRELQSKLTRSEEARRHLETEFQAAQNRATTAERDRDTANSQLESRTTEVNNLEARVAQLTNQLQSVSEEFDRASKLAGDHYRVLTETVRQLTEAKSELQRLTEQAGSLEQQLAHTEETADLKYAELFLEELKELDEELLVLCGLVPKGTSLNDLPKKLKEKIKDAQLRVELGAR